MIQNNFYSTSLLYRRIERTGVTVPDIRVEFTHCPHPKCLCFPSGKLEPPLPPGNDRTIL